MRAADPRALPTAPSSARAAELRPEGVFGYPAHVVTLGGREARRALAAQCHAAGILDVRFVDAVDARDAEAMAPLWPAGDRFDHVPCSHERGLCAKKVAMWASRQRALRAISASGRPGLLLESDVVFLRPEAFARRAHALVDEAQRFHGDWDVIYFGHCLARMGGRFRHSCNATRESPDSGVFYSKQVPAACTHAMFFSAESAARTAELNAQWALEYLHHTRKQSRRNGFSRCRLDKPHPEPSVGCQKGNDARMSEHVRSGRLSSLLAWDPLVYQREGYAKNLTPHTYNHRLPEACELIAQARRRAARRRARPWYRRLGAWLLSWAG